MLSKEQREEIINELKEQYPILEQVKFNEFNINSKLMENTELYIKYQELYKHEQFIYNQLEEKMDHLKGQRYDFYKFENDRVLTKTEIEQYYLPRDPKIIKMNKIMDKQKIKMDYFKICMDSIEKVYWRMKEFLKNEG